MQSQASAASRNSSSAAAIPSKVSTPSSPVTLGKAPDPGVNGQRLGSAVKGFDGGLIPGKV